MPNPEFKSHSENLKNSVENNDIQLEEDVIQDYENALNNLQNLVDNSKYLDNHEKTALKNDIGGVLTNAASSFETDLKNFNQLKQAKLAETKTDLALRLVEFVKWLQNMAESVVKEKGENWRIDINDMYITDSEFVEIQNEISKARSTAEKEGKGNYALSQKITKNRKKLDKIQTNTFLKGETFTVIAGDSLRDPKTHKKLDKANIGETFMVIDGAYDQRGKFTYALIKNNKGKEFKICTNDGLQVQTGIKIDTTGVQDSFSTYGKNTREINKNTYSNINLKKLDIKKPKKIKETLNQIINNLEQIDKKEVAPQILNLVLLNYEKNTIYKTEIIKVCTNLYGSINKYKKFMLENHPNMINKENAKIMLRTDFNNDLQLQKTMIAQYRKHNEINSSKLTNIEFSSWIQDFEKDGYDKNTILHNITWLHYGDRFWNPQTCFWKEIKQNNTLKNLYLSECCHININSPSFKDRFKKEFTLIGTNISEHYDEYDNTMTKDVVKNQKKLNRGMTCPNGMVVDTAQLISAMSAYVSGKDSAIPGISYAMAYNMTEGGNSYEIELVRNFGGDAKEAYRQYPPSQKLAYELGIVFGKEIIKEKWKNVPLSQFFIQVFEDKTVKPFINMAYQKTKEYTEIYNKAMIENIAPKTLVGKLSDKVRGFYEDDKSQSS